MGCSVPTPGEVMKKIKSKFQDWFTEQYGRDIMPEDKFLELIDKTKDYLALLNCCEYRLKQERELREARTGALYAWQVNKEKIKKNVKKGKAKR